MPGAAGSSHPVPLLVTWTAGSACEADHDRARASVSLLYGLGFTRRPSLRNRPVPSLRCHSAADVSGDAPLARPVGCADPIPVSAEADSPLGGVSMNHSERDHSSRGTFLSGAVAAGVGAALAGARMTLAPGASAAGTCPDTVPSILATLLLTERLATTFYYTALTSPGVMRNRQLGGSSTDALDPGLPPNGNPSHVRS